MAFAPEEEIGGNDGADKFSLSKGFQDLNVGIMLDERLPSPNDHYRTFYADMSLWWLKIKFDLIKAGLKADGEVIFINMGFLKAGTPSPTLIANKGCSKFRIWRNSCYKYNNERDGNQSGYYTSRALWYLTPDDYSEKAVHLISLGKVMSIAKMMKAEFDNENYSLSAIGGVENVAT
ncbi:hypothetical protein KIW84_022213 [Lathyrus oleraceus]|uniref:Uncharacterized protein n=1 Tax=Pisum sativum TaxID=3888 RepID=A0A9D4YDU5_PEA|nr:hypothetical protein KIW84_022213 [Pisum sativum]